MAECAHCGVEAPAGARFCEGCGRRLVASAPSAKAAPKAVAAPTPRPAPSRSGSAPLPKRPARTLASYFPSGLTLLARADGTVAADPVERPGTAQNAPKVALAVAVVLILLNPQVLSALIIAFLPLLILLLVAGWMTGGKVFTVLGMMRRAVPRGAAMLGEGLEPPRIVTFPITTADGERIEVSLRTREATVRRGDRVAAGGYVRRRHLHVIWLDNDTAGTRSVAAGALLTATSVLLLLLALAALL